MSYKSRYVILAPFAAFIFLTSVAFAQEQSIQKKDVPEAVLDAFQKLYPHATVKGYAKDLEEGIITYEVESEEGGVHRDVTFNEDGTLISVEESMAFADLPEPVRKTISQDYPKAKISLCERIIKGPTTQYEVLLASGKKKYEVVLDADGTVVKKENK